MYICTCVYTRLFRGSEENGKFQLDLDVPRRFPFVGHPFRFRPRVSLLGRIFTFLRPLFFVKKKKTNKKPAVAKAVSSRRTFQTKSSPSIIRFLYITILRIVVKTVTANRSINEFKNLTPNVIDIRRVYKVCVCVFLCVYGCVCVKEKTRARVNLAKKFREIVRVMCAENRNDVRSRQTSHRIETAKKK